MKHAPKNEKEKKNKRQIYTLCTKIMSKQPNNNNNNK